MILDSLGLFWDNAGFGDASNAVDLSTEDRGMGEPIKISFTCAGGDMAGATGLILSTATTEGGSYTDKATYAFTAAQLNDGVSFTITPDQGLDRWAKLAFTGTASAGTGITAAIVKDAQTNR